MGVMAGEADELFLFQLLVRLRIDHTRFVMTIKTKDVSYFSQQGSRLAFMDIMADDAIHGSRSMNKRAAFFQVFVAFHAHIFGWDNNTTYSPVAERTIILSFCRGMLVSRYLGRWFYFFRLLNFSGFN